MNRDISIDTRLNIMDKWRLQSQEYDFVLYCFLSREENGMPEYLSRWFNIHGPEVLMATLHNLKKNGVIVASYKIPGKGEVFIPDDVEFKKSFLNSWLKESEDLGQEFFDAYPSFIDINGKTASLKNITKIYKNFGDFCRAYGKSIKFNPETHQEVLELLDIGKRAGVVNSNICDFIESRRYLTIREEVENGGIMNRNIESKFI